MSKPPCSYFAIAEVGLLMTSRCTFFKVGFGEPHQFETASKSTDWPGVRAVILKGPVPTARSGLVHQLSKSCLTVFWSTMAPVAPESVMAETNQPAGALNLTWTVLSSGALNPDRVTDGSFFSSSAWRAAPVTVFLATLL